MISTLRSAEASAACTVARAGAAPGGSQASQTAFISAKFAMSVSQTCADNSLLLSLPALASNESICVKISFLIGRVFALGLFRDNPGEINRVVMDDSAAQPGAGFVTLYCHSIPHSNDDRPFCASRKMTSGAEHDKSHAGDNGMTRLAWLIR
jgi:hypothetical protein